MQTRTKLFVLMILFNQHTACSNIEPTKTAVPPTEIPDQPTMSITPVDVQGATPQNTGNVARTLLTYDDWMKGFDAVSPVDEAALTFPTDAAPPKHIFEGHLELRGENATGEMIVLRGNPDQEPEVRHLPEFDFEFVQSDDGYLIPVQRGLIIADHPIGTTFSNRGGFGRRTATWITPGPPSPLLWSGKVLTPFSMEQ